MSQIKKLMIKKLISKEIKGRSIQNCKIKLITTFKFIKTKIKINRKKMIFTKTSRMSK